MHSGDDFIPNYKPYRQSGGSTAMLAQVPSSVQPLISNSTRPESSACSYSLGKRCTIQNHDVLCLPFKDNPSLLKRQRLAMHINTRHMVPYHPGVLQYQHNLAAPVQAPIDQFPSFQQPEPNIETNQSKSKCSNNGMKGTIVPISLEMDTLDQNALRNMYITEANVQSAGSNISDQHNNPIIPLYTNVSTLLSGDTVTHAAGEQVSTNCNAFSEAKSSFHTRQQKQGSSHDTLLLEASKKPSINLSETRLSTLHPHSGVNATASSSQITMDHMDTRNVIHTGFFKGIQEWVNAIEYICGFCKQKLWSELFGDDPTLIADTPDLLKLLKDIDQKKNQITHGEEHATGLINAILKVLATCNNATEKESIMLAGKILDNLLQRFQAVHFQGGSATG